MSMQYLKALLKSHGVTQTELARVLGRDKSAITNLMQGKRQLKAEEVIKIAEFLKVTELEVLGRPAQEVAAAASVIASPAGLGEGGRIPFFTSPTIATGSSLIGQEGGRYYFEDSGVVTSDMYALEVKDDSLNLAGFIPGDIVISDMKAPIKRGSIVIVQQYVSDSAETLLRFYQPPFLLPHSTVEGFDKLHEERANVRIVSPIIKLVRLFH